MFQTFKRWDRESRKLKPKSFKMVGGVQFVDVGAYENGLLVNGPYLKSDYQRASESFQLEYLRGGGVRQAERGAVIEVLPYMAKIMPYGVVKPRRNEAKVEKSRGKIRGFSSKARLRMMRRIRSLGELPKVFATMTYDDTVIMNDGQDELVKRVHRDIHRLGAYAKVNWSELGMIWRIEWAWRLSGILAGWVVPHVHFLIYGIKDSEIEKRGVEFREAWLRYTGTKNEKALQVTMHKESWKKIEGGKAVGSYVSKYTAKESGDQGFDTGRHWGVIGNVPRVKGFYFDVDAGEVNEIRRFLDRWFQSHYPGMKYFSHQIIKGNTAYIYLEEMYTFQLVELAADLADEKKTPF